MNRARQAYLLSGPLPLRSGITLITFKPFHSLACLANLTSDGLHANHKKRIMVVDDESDIASMFRSGLERNGFSVEVFNDPYDALSHFKPEYYDLLLFDVRMPRMSGFELYREIRKQDVSAKVCFISAFEVHQEEMKKILPEEDERCVVRKPVSMKELVRIINEALAKNA